MATRIKTEVTSKGSSSLVKSIWLICAMLSAALLRSPPTLDVPSATALRQKDEAEQAEEGSGPGDADGVGCAAALGAFFNTGIEQHNDEDEEHHDSAGVRQ